MSGFGGYDPFGALQQHQDAMDALRYAMMGMDKRRTQYVISTAMTPKEARRENEKRAAKSKAFREELQQETDRWLKL